jgi:3-ketosteroid 9alpha-monooxygenase subunit A
MKSFPHASMPWGWYQVAWSAEIPAGAVRPLRYFDTELVCYRGADGSVRVFDAYCPHMGAHLGYGGTVEEADLRCPFHGWKWGPDGRNTEVPSHPTGGTLNLKLHSWPVRELHGIVLVWYHPAHQPPSFEPTAFLPRADGDYWPAFPAATKLWPDRAMVGQLIAENLADAAHFRYVHGAGELPAMESYTMDAGRFASSFSVRFGVGRQSTWATPKGPMTGCIAAEAWGLGLVITKLAGFDEILHLAATTPVTSDTADVRATTWVPVTRSDGAEMTAELRDRWVGQQNQQTEADLVVWENLRYVAKPPLVGDEAAPMRALREWADRFYRDTAAAEGGE